MSHTAPSAFFVPVGDQIDDDRIYDVFDPTEYTASLWAGSMQHGAPPAALAVRAMERLVQPGTEISRVVIDLLGVVPITQTRARAWVSRPGRTISLITAELDCVQPDGSYRTVARAQAWALAHTDTTESVRDLSPSPPSREGDLRPLPEFFEAVRDQGFLGACEWRFVESPVNGARACWIRPKVPLVAGEQPSPLVQLFSVADAANGVGAKLDYLTTTWMNMDMTVHLHRSPRPVDGWIGIIADQLVGDGGLGTTVSRLYDDAGAFAVGAQTLLVTNR